MWLPQIWIALVVSCAAPGTDNESCHGELVRAFASQEYCSHAVQAITRLMGTMKPTGLTIAVHAQCAPVKPDREA